MAESAPTAAWWAEGDLFEGCNCNVVCPCHADFRQNSTHETCDNLWGIHIDAGEYGGLDLSGLNALVVAASPGPSMFAGNWTALVFLDDQATPNQHAALEEILSGRAGGPWERMARFYAGEAPQFCRPAAFVFSKSDRSPGSMPGKRRNSAGPPPSFSANPTAPGLWRLPMWRPCRWTLSGAPNGMNP